MKKIFLIIFLILFFFSLIPIQTQAGLVPCGAKVDNPATPYIDESQPCTLCHIFVLFKNIIDFLLIPTPVNGGVPLVPIIAGLMIGIGGFLFFFVAESPESVQKGTNIIKSTIIGLLIIYAAWVIVNAFFGIIGVAEWTGLKTWWQIPCP